MNFHKLRDTNNNEYITSWTMFFKLYIENLKSPINFISLFISITSFIIEIIPLKIRIAIILSCLFVSCFISLYKSLNKIFKSTKDLKNNRDTILNTYNNYKENRIPYENMCNEICIAIEVTATENARNAALKRLKDLVDRIKSKYIDEGGTN